MPSFVDEAQLHVKAGNGGAGAVSFRREAHVSKGGPDGGDGGRGGDVVLVATANLASLLSFRDHPHRRAAPGVHGQGKNRRGANGAATEVPVPVGTVVRSLDGTLVADLAAAGARFVAARGGRGGSGNARFLSNRRRAPSFAEQGEVGEEHWFDLELKLLADVALVGFPNAGKSTLLATVSAARPKIADYPFTTLEPNLGVVSVGSGADVTEFVMADVPGLVEGAAAGRGLGHRFLRHVERARVLLVLLDLAAADGRSASSQYEVLVTELGRYRPELLERPRLVVGSRADLVPAPQRPELARPAEIVISSVTGEGIAALVGRLAAAVARARSGEAGGGEESAEVAEPGALAAAARRLDAAGIRLVPASTTSVVHRPSGEDLAIRRDPDGTWVVEGRRAVRAVALSDLTDAEAEQEVQDRLRRLGLERALVRAGVRDGDVVRLGPLTFTYHADDVVVAPPPGRGEDGGRRRRST